MITAFGRTVPAGQKRYTQMDQTGLIEELKKGKPAPSIFSDVDSQLGLTLKPAKQQTDFLTIDHFGRLVEN